VTALRPDSMACWVPPYMAESYRRETTWPVNTPQDQSDDVLMIDGRVKAEALKFDPAGPSQVWHDAAGEPIAQWITRADMSKLPDDSEGNLPATAYPSFPTAPGPPLATWNYTWELVLANAGQIAEDFRAAGRSGIEGTVEEPSALRGSRNDIYVAPGAKIHPMVVLDAEHGPIYIDEGAEIHPFTRIEGPCYVGRRSILLGAKCREGNSIGPMCRIGGEVEESIIHGYSNKYHDGFLGHAYVGQWVNLGALTTNSDLKNDYSGVSVTLDGRTQIATGSTKVGALIGDHAKTSIGTLLNTGACVGAMTLLVAGGGLMPKFIPSFTWCLNNAIIQGTGKESLYATAKVAMSRRKHEWTAADAALWDAIYDLTAPEREEAIARSQRMKR
jgi:UDP-N-acetylglucosamine diphosphorylase / glucose-1-phosphate thymidylyltransferase / UDP-N-acetylgalactosamine diphosphorylase / glucosamine-1-phosphate N-acetyltransferase / galactosamine-1-phosphate N-acetyltransferase